MISGKSNSYDIKREIYFIYYSLVGHFQNQTGHFWPAGMGLDGPVLTLKVGVCSFLPHSRSVDG